MRCATSPPIGGWRAPQLNLAPLTERGRPFFPRTTVLVRMRMVTLLLAHRYHGRYGLHFVRGSRAYPRGHRVRRRVRLWPLRSASSTSGCCLLAQSMR